MKRLSRFVASILAVRYTGKGEELDHLPITIEAEDHKKALDEALKR